MRFFDLVFSGAALIAAVMAVEFNDVPKSFEAGKTYTITYSPKDNTPTTIKLRQGDPNNLNTLATITASATGGSFTYTVPANLPNAPNYALEISQAGSQPNYSGLIPLTGSTYSSVAASSSASATSTKASSSSSAAYSATSAHSSSTKSASSTLATTISPSIGTSASAGPTLSAGSNSTISATRTPSSSVSPTSGSSPPQQTANAGAFLASSPVALILGAVAAMVYL